MKKLHSRTNDLRGPAPIERHAFHTCGNRIYIRRVSYQEAARLSDVPGAPLIAAYPDVVTEDSAEAYCCACRRTVPWSVEGAPERSSTEGVKALLTRRGIGFQERDTPEPCSARIGPTGQTRCERTGTLVYKTHVYCMICLNNLI